VSNNKEADNDWFNLESNRDGTRLVHPVAFDEMYMLVLGVYQLSNSTVVLFK